MAPKQKNTTNTEKLITMIDLPKDRQTLRALAGEDREHYTLLESTFGCQIRRREYTLFLSSFHGATQNTNHEKAAQAINSFIALHSQQKHAGYGDLVDIINQIGIPDITFNSHNPHSYKAEKAMSKKHNKNVPAYQREEEKRNANVQEEVKQNKGDMIVNGIKGGIHAKTENHKNIVKAVNTHDVVFATGQAGTGKTYIGVALAVKALKAKEVERIIITRPAVEAEENLGFLPGDLKEKVDPYLRPIYDALHDIYNPEQIEEMLAKNTLEIAPLAFMRGRTLDKAFVILDEAQNTTASQMKMFLTRLGKSSKYYITGDVTQIDLPRHKDSGLRFALDALSHNNGIKFIELNGEDTMRHKLVASMITDFEALEEKRHAEAEAKKAAKKAEYAANSAANNNAKFLENGSAISAPEKVAEHASVLTPITVQQNGVASIPRP